MSGEEEDSQVVDLEHGQGIMGIGQVLQNLGVADIRHLGGF